MRLFSDCDMIPAFRYPVVTVGSFDGVHLGHAHLIDIMKERAAMSGGETIVVTFSEHPRKVLQSEDDIKLLTSLKEKALLLERAGVDNLCVMRFDREVSELSPEEFLRDFLIGKLGARELVVGYNHHFGHNKQGDAAMLKELETKYGFRIHEAPRFDSGGDKTSSTTIRKAVAEGDMRRVGRLLGHPYIVMAAVGHAGELMTDEPLKLLPGAGRYYVDVNGRNGVATVGADGSVALETSAPLKEGSELLISF